MPDDINGEARARKRSGSARRRHGPAVASPEGLERAAHAYLARYSAPAGHLRRILLARVARSARFHGTDAEAGAAVVASLVARLSAQGLVDDAAYAHAAARRLMGRGLARRAIHARLRAKGVGADEADDALAALAQEAADPDLAAALAFARRRRLGPFRPAAERANRRLRDLAAMARRGFEPSVARRVIDTRTPDGLEDLEAEASGTA
jgi:regulatory protein